jgi:hypothetical protein
MMAFELLMECAKNRLTAVQLNLQKQAHFLLCPLPTARLNSCPFEFH